MRDIIKKALTVALAAVLVFVALVPVPVGNQRFDSVTHQKAEAAVPAVAVPVIAATVLAACGVYIVGTTEITYNGNRTTVANALVQYLGTTIYDGTEAASEALSSCVTPEGNIDLGALAQTGILGAIPAFASAMINNGMASSGENSAVEGTDVIEWNGCRLYREGTSPTIGVEYTSSYLQSVLADSQYVYVGCTLQDDNRRAVGDHNFPKYYYTYYFMKNWNNDYVVLNPYVNGNGEQSFRMACYTVTVTLNGDNTVFGNNRLNSSEVNAIVTPERTSGNYSYKSYISSAFDVNINESIVRPQTETVAAAVSDYVLSNEYEAPTAVVEPFEPTEEQLSAGYDSTAVIEAQIGEVNGNLADVIARINAQTQTLSGIGTTLEALRGLVNGTATNVDAISLALNAFPGLLQGILDAVSPLNNGLSGILTALNPLAAILSAVTSILGVLTGLQASPFTWLSSWWGTLSANWQDLLDWLGATPFGQAVGGVIDALGQVGAGVAAGAADVLGGVQAIGQTLAGELQGVLDGVLSIPASIAATLDGILAAEAEAQYTPSGEGLRLRDELRAQLEAQLDMKAPFCYMRRMQALASTVSGNFGGSPSFYFDVDMPYAGVQRFDAGELLNQEWGTLTLAQYIRVMITATLCAGLLAVSLKIAIGRIGNKEG